MPELPEVETVRNYLKENILNKKIINIQSNRKKTLKIIIVYLSIFYIQSNFYYDFLHIDISKI